MISLHEGIAFADGGITAAAGTTLGHYLLII